jgi:hypothetical protein
MNEQVDPKELVSGDEQFQDQICDKCGALIVMDMETGEPLCNCISEAEMAAQVAAAREAQKNAAPAQPQSPAPRPQPKNVPPVEAAPPAAEGDNPADVAPQQEMPVFSAKDALRAIPGAPAQEQIDAWKQEFGAVYTFPFDTKEIYIWRPMRRREWQMLQSNEALVKEEAKFQEQVVMRSVLWPKIGPVELNLSRAGLIQTLFSVIMQGSYFLHPDFAITLVEEL